MLKGIFGKRKPASYGARPLPQEMVDEDETIIINVSGTQTEAPPEVTLDLPPQTAPAKPRAAAAPEADPDATVVMTATDLAREARVDPGARTESSPGVAPATVGWLCVVSDAGRNRGFPVGLGRNRIGRGPINQVFLDVGDGTISQENHLSLVADPKNRKFHLVPGESTNLAYLNDEAVLQPVEIKDRDVLQLGMTRLVFVQYFGNYADWD